MLRIHDVSMPARVRVRAVRVSESANIQIAREGGDLGRKGAHRLTSRPSPPPSLLHSMQRGSAALMTFSGGPERCGPSPSDTHGSPRYSGGGGGGDEREGERERRERGSVITKEIPPEFSSTHTNHH